MLVATFLKPTAIMLRSLSKGDLRAGEGLGMARGRSVVGVGELLSWASESTCMAGGWGSEGEQGLAAYDEVQEEARKAAREQWG